MANPRLGAVIPNQKRPINPPRSYEQPLEPFYITRIPALNLKGYLGLHNTEDLT